MEQVVVEIARAGALEGGVELLLGAGLIVALHRGIELGAEGEAVARIAVDERLAGDLLGLAVVVDVGRVEIGAARLDEAVDHLTDGLHVDAAVLALGEAHQAEAQLENVLAKICLHERALRSCPHRVRSVIFIIYDRAGDRQGLFGDGRALTPRPRCAIIIMDKATKERQKRK